jgi:hypothetical protein
MKKIFDSIKIVSAGYDKALLYALGNYCFKYEEI